MNTSTSLSVQLGNDRTARCTEAPTWHDYDRSEDRGRIVMPAFVRAAELGGAAFLTDAAASQISPATKRHPGTHVWSPPT